MSIKKPSAVESPYVTIDTTPTRLASAPVAGGGVSTVSATVTETVSAVVTANADTTSSSTGSNVSYYATGLEGIAGLADYGQVFAGANVYVTLEQPQYNTYNQTITSNGTPGGSNGQIQFNNNSVFAGSSNLTFDGANIIVDGIKTDNYYYANGSPFSGGGSGASLPLANGTSNFNIATANGNATIATNGADTWTFDTNGKLTAPGEVYGQYYTIRGGNDPGTDIGSLGYGGNIVTVFGYEGFNIETGEPESGPLWQFSTTGNLTVPGIIQGSADSDYTLKLGAFPEEVNAGRYLQVRSGDVADHIHFDTSNNSAWNFYVGSDNQYVLLGNTGNISIGSYDSGNSTTYQWLFDTTGGLTLPGNAGANNASISSIENGQIVKLNSQANGYVGMTGFDSAGNNVAAITAVGVDGETDRVIISVYNPNIDDGEAWTFNNAGDFTTAGGNIFFGTQAGDPVIVPGGSGVKIAADRSDITQGYVNVTSSGITIDALGSSTSDITIRAGDDVVIRGGDKVSAPQQRGGDITIAPGTGGDDGGAGAGNGGYVEIVGGDGGIGVNNSAGTGGEVNLVGGYGGSGNIDNAIVAGDGGMVILIGGTGGNNLDDLTLNGPGGNVEIYGGQGSIDVANNRPGGPAGHVFLRGGNWGYNFVETGNVHIETYNGNDFLNWEFDNQGRTYFPGLSTARGDTTSGTLSGFTLRIGDGSNEAVITTPDGDANSVSDSQRIVINPGKGADLTSGEGGDIYLWAGRGGSGDQANAVSAGSGGDIKVRGGQGGGVNGDGGYIRMEAGDGATGSEGNSGSAGFIEITGGGSGIGKSGGYVRITSGQGDLNGGDANLVGGTGVTGTGGTVNITGGTSGNGLADYGNVNITSGASTWTFNNTGTLIVPGEGVVRSINDTIELQSYDVANTTAYKARLGTNGGVYLEIGNAEPWLTFTNDTGDAEIGAAPGAAGTGNAGYDLFLFGGSADTSAYGTGAGGNIQLRAGYGAGNDGGGGGPGGWVNIIAGDSTDPAGVSGNVAITSGSNTWTFDNTGSFVFPGAGVTMDGQNNALLTSGLANVTIGTFVQGADGGVSWEYQGDGSGNSSYGAVGLDTAGTANTANLQFKVQLVSDQGNVSTNKEWIFNTAGNLTAPGSIITSTGSGGNISGANVVTANIVVTTPVALANLTAVAGGRAFVNNANLVAAGNFGAQVGSGGSNIVPVWSNGTNWYIG